jgi:tRNA-specific 2-thiouridylase
MPGRLVNVHYAALLSGGVDSSVALLRLTESNKAPVTAYYLKVWLEDELDYLGECPWEEDLRFARAVCELAGVELCVVPLQLEYYERVVQYTLSELKAGRTPSPDIFCNRRIKFGAFLEYVQRECGSDVAVATGHYAGTRESADHVELIRSPDPVKDQTYFLSHLSQEQLQRIVFPLQDLQKAEVRELASRYSLPNQDRKDSQGICFLGKIRYSQFIQHYLGEQPGEIVHEETGRVLGSHNGYWFHTIGQRQGLGLSGGPWYVTRKDVGRNVIYVSHSEAIRDQERDRFRIGKLSWTWRPPDNGSVTIKIRHGPAMIRSLIAWLDHETIGVTMEEGDRGVAPGQFAVLYDGDTCLGAGTILEEAPEV